jgi:hypothetical protein
MKIYIVRYIVALRDVISNARQMVQVYSVLRDVLFTLAEEYKLRDLINRTEKENIATQNEVINKQQKVHDMTVLINSDQMGRASRKYVYKFIGVLKTKFQFRDIKNLLMIHGEYR